MSLHHHASRLSALLFAASLTAACTGDVPEHAGAQGDREGAAISADRIVVDFVDGTLEADFDGWESAWNVDVEFNSVVGVDSGVTIATVTGDVDAVLKRIRQHPSVQSAERLRTYSSTSLTPNDPGWEKQWHLRAVGGPSAWDVTRGRGVVVAVIDTGVAHTAYDRWAVGEDLADTRFVAGYDFVNDRPEVIDDQGHGTHVAGTIAEATDNGVGASGLAFEATIMPLKVLSATGSGTSADIADAIRWAADHDADVINMSLGGGGFSQAMFDAITYARDHGVVVVAAAGNSGFGEVEYPAAYDGVIAVSATDGLGAITDYSSFGEQLDIAAPGGDSDVDANGDGHPDGVYQNTIDPKDPKATRYEFFNGTSMATPHVAATAALVMSLGVTDPATVEDVLLGSATPESGQDGWSRQYGWGQLNAEAAVTKATMDLGKGRLTALFALLLLFWLGRRRIALRVVPFVGAAVVAGTGLFVLPLVTPMFPGRGLLATPVMDWGLLAFGPGGHAHVLLWSALGPVLLAGLLYSVRGARSLVAGFNLGAAAFLLHAAFSGHADVGWLPGGIVQVAWLVANAAVALGVAWLASRTDSTLALPRTV